MHNQDARVATLRELFVFGPECRSRSFRNQCSPSPEPAAALHAAFGFGRPQIWNSDQSSQFTSADFLAPLKKHGISTSMDGHGRALDVFIERLWRSWKYELIYPRDFATGPKLFPALANYFHFYNHERPHQALGYQTPADLFPHKAKRKRSLS